MAYKISSKYKHAVPKEAKRENWFNGVPANLEAADASQLIKASATYIAFPSSTIGTVSVLDINKPGKFDHSSVPQLNAHSGLVTDLDFSPFFDNVLASGGEDGTVKHFVLERDGSGSVENATEFKAHSKKVENIKFHPRADGVVATCGGTELKLWDVNTSSEKISVSGFKDTVQSLSVKSDGTLLSATSKDKQLTLVDPRGSGISAQVESHKGVKASVAIFLGNLDKIFSTGFTKTREREYCMWDSRNLGSPLVREQLDSSTGVLLPLFDQDSNMLFIAGKGDVSVQWWEIQPEKKPFFQWAGSPSTSKEQQKGVAMVPKRGVNVMDCEVNRLMKLTKDSVIPLSFNVTRKTYSIFHDDLFPDTLGDDASQTADEWFSGTDAEPKLISLDPARRKSLRPIAASGSDNTTSTEAVASELEQVSVSKPDASFNDNKASEPEAPRPAAPVYKFNAVRTTKYKYITGKALHPRNNYDHLKDIGLKMSGECNVLEASSKFLAIPLNKPGGQVGIIPVENKGRQPSKLPAVVNQAEMLDLAWNPFDPHMLATASDDCSVRLWKIPAGGLQEDTTEYSMRLTGHLHRINIVRFHPLVENLLVTSSPEQDSASIKYWDLKTGKNILTIPNLGEQVFGIAFSYDGAKLVVVSKDLKIRIFEAHTGKLLQEGDSHAGSRGARVAWCGKRDQVVSVGFDKSSNREIRLYDANNLSQVVGSVTLDVSPGILVPTYDEDTDVIYLWGRGDASVTFLEVSDEAPHLHYLTKFDGAGLQIGISFMPKWEMDVIKVEIARAYRLTQKHVETVTFTVPRKKPEYFQDDIFLPTRDLTNPAMTLDDFLAGNFKQAPTKNLQPEGMKPVSEAPVEVFVPKYESRKPDVLSREEQNEQVVESLFQSAREQVKDEALPQDQMEGVDEDEWDDY
eukprot:NODE_41_length_2867_cov_51.688686_g25_i0.p1 GENE.NODE_41_length_2867_cov_51.688686_g25_i0~~NODE_41_length_2867_cov_51.688686_g25_i0.p1  ORF type:complete len:948 (+),score=188.13 NODE_41_length_2867_cov_51.688686_g25_i0:110-2845(+)